MKILIPGIDGYIGWTLALRQLQLGNEICGIDNFSRRKNVKEMGSHSALPILEMKKRIKLLKKTYEDKISFYEGDFLDSDFTNDIVRKFSPDVIVHLAEQPSAPYSMIDQEHNIYTQKNNVLGTLNLLHSIQKYVPKAHLVKLGTMGEYGYDPGLDIPEGFFEVETPILQPLPGGAIARPFKTRLNALNQDVYLRIAPELYLKRLLVGGFEKIFEILQFLLD